MMHPITELLYTIIWLYSLVVWVWFILDILIAFKIVNAYQPAVRKIFKVLVQLVEPALAPIRKFLPRLGGIDLSPALLLLMLHFVQRLLVYYF